MCVNFCVRLRRTQKFTQENLHNRNEKSEPWEKTGIGTLADINQHQAGFKYQGS